MGLRQEGRVRGPGDGRWRGQRAHPRRGGSGAAACTHSRGGLHRGHLNGLGYSHRGTGECELGPHGSHDVTLDFLYAPDGKRTILSDSKLLDNHGIQAIKTPGPGQLLFRDGSKVPLVRANGLFYCDVMFRRSAPIAAQARLRADDLALLWAARLNLSADNLVLTSKAVLGVNVDKVTPTQREMLARSRWPGT